MFSKNLVSGKELLQYGLSKKIAIGAFNFSNMEIIQAIVESANDLDTPVILQASESAINYMGFDYVLALVQAAAKTSKVPLALHLDHGKDLDICKKCIENGFTSVMIDKSSLPFEENIEKTKEVVDYASKFGVSVEAELGTLAGVEDDVNVSAKDAFYTDPSAALEFIEKTKVDSLAIAIGTSHGPNKGKSGNPKLDIDRLAEIKQKVGDLPLVLHGASSVYADSVENCNKYGADIKNAIQNGVAKINVDTDIRISFLAGLRKIITENPSSIDMRKYLGNARDFSKEIIIRKMKTFLGI